MSRRLLASYLALTFVVLVALEVPLAIVNARTERQDLTAKVERDAFAAASLAEDTLQAGQDSPELQKLARVVPPQAPAAASSSSTSTGAASPTRIPPPPANELRVAPGDRRRAAAARPSTGIRTSDDARRRTCSTWRCRWPRQDGSSARFGSRIRPRRSTIASTATGRPWPQSATDRARRRSLGRPPARAVVHASASPARGSRCARRRRRADGPRIRGRRPARRCAASPVS